MSEIKLTEFVPGKGSRIQLTDGGRRQSTVWRIFSARHAADLYITPLMVGGAVKVSLHQSGSWNVGLTAEHAAQSGIQAHTRHWEVWKRGGGEDVGPGLTRAWYLMIPDEELRVGVPDPKAYPIPAVGPGHAASIEVLIALNDGPTLVFEETAIIGLWRLAGRAESCLVISRRIPWSPDLQAWAKELRVQLVAQAEAAGVAPSADHRYYVHGHNADGVRFGLELSATIPPN